MKREPNLFEAFQTASKKSAGGTPPPDESASTEPLLPKGVWRGARGGSMAAASLSRLGLVFGAAVLLAFAAGYLVGNGRQEVKAQTGGARQGASDAPLGNQPERPWFALEGVQDAPQKPPGESNSTVSGGSGLYNPANLYTVLAITYADVPSNQGRAKMISEYLRGLGLPAFEPISNKGSIEVLVGAAEDQDALKTLEKRVQSTPGPSGSSYDFKTAYVVNIDNHVNRD